LAKTIEARVTLRDEMTFDATATSDHTVVLDASQAVGGHDRGFRPMEMILMGLGGCTGMDTISLLRKMRQEVTGYEVRLEGVRAEEHPKVYTEITVEHVVRGRGLQEEMVRKAIDLSANRYCPAGAMLGKVAALTHTYRMIDEDSGAEQTGAL
jgi:putative redox protein